MVFQYADGTNVWWLDERDGGLRKLGTTTGNVPITTQGSVYSEKEGDYVDVTTQMENLGYDMTDTKTAMIMGADEKPVYRDYTVMPNRQLDFRNAKDYTLGPDGNFIQLINGSPVTNAMAEHDKSESEGTAVFSRDYRFNPDTADAVSDEVNFDQFNTAPPTQDEPQKKEPSRDNSPAYCATFDQAESVVASIKTTTETFDSEI